jgi:hypothetical protein
MLEGVGRVVNIQLTIEWSLQILRKHWSNLVEKLALNLVTWRTMTIENTAVQTKGTTT